MDSHYDYIANVVEFNSQITFSGYYLVPSVLEQLSCW